MKRVSFKVAKAIKDAGYPQDYENAEDTYTNLNGGIWVKPTYIQVWLWLWRFGRFKIDLDECFGVCMIYDTSILEYRKNGDIHTFKYTDPEDAIIAAIEYLVDNDLIK